ncbi:MAG: succinate dehydrogenase [Planctomycetota bacterium]
MSTAASPSTATTPGAGLDPLALYRKNHFLLRRLHSLTGIMPVGVFVIFHLFTNMQMALAELLGDTHYFQEEVDFIHSLPALLFLELFGLWLPIAFHAGLGVLYIFSGKSNSFSYKFGGNLRYTLQRWSAWLALAFIFFHVATLRWGWTLGVIEYPFIGRAEGPSAMAAFGQESVPLAHATTALSLQTNWAVALFYLVGALAVVYHWSNGLWTAAITWGLTTTQKAMNRWGLVCLGMGLTLSAFTVAAVWGALTYEIPDELPGQIRTYLNLKAQE